MWPCLFLNHVLRRIVPLLWSLRRSSAESGTGGAAALLQEVAERFQLRTVGKLQLVDARVSSMFWAEPGNLAIVLPRQFVISLSDDQQRCIIAHELGHVVRRDHRGNVFAFLVSTLFRWNPMAWLARRQISATAEACCDALALERLNGLRKSYAATLLTVRVSSSIHVTLRGGDIALTIVGTSIRETESRVSPRNLTRNGPGNPLESTFVDSSSSARSLVRDE